MSDTSASVAGAPGTITVVDTGDDHSPSTAHSEPSRKRSRADAGLPPVEEGSPSPLHRPQDGGVPTFTVNENDEDDDDEMEEDKSDIQRLLDAKHRRRRLGRHMAKDQIEEDLADVKKFLALPEEDKEAYLSIYEYDGSDDNLLEGLAKASALALRFGLAYTVEPKNYDLVSMALDFPEVKDSMATIWDFVDISEHKSTKTIKMVAAVGHIGDTLMGAAMKLYQAVGRASELRDRKEELARNRASGIQSVFDLTGTHGDASSSTYAQGASTSTSHASSGFSSTATVQTGGTITVLAD